MDVGVVSQGSMSAEYRNQMMYRNPIRQTESLNTLAKVNGR